MPKYIVDSINLARGCVGWQHLTLGTVGTLRHAEYVKKKNGVSIKQAT